MNFEAVLLSMRAIKNVDVGQRKRLGHGLAIDLDPSKGCLEGVRTAHRDSAKRDPVGGSEQDDPSYALPEGGQTDVGRCCDRAGEDVSGVGNNERFRHKGLRRLGDNPSEAGRDHASQLLGLVGIEEACYGSRSYAHRDEILLPPRVLASA